MFGISPALLSVAAKAPFALNITSDTADLNVRTAALSTGWDGSAEVICTISSGKYVYATSTAGYACVISGSFPGGVKLVNYGYICGRGGTGGTGSEETYPYGAAATNGGPALYADTACKIDNQSYILGGGGGGGGGGSASKWIDKLTQVFGTGGGGGGGISGNNTYVGGGGDPGYKSGWTTGASGSPGNKSGAGAGGAGGASVGGTGGAGGSWGAAGSSGSAAGAGATGYRAASPYGAGGAAVVGNSYITWINVGNRYGSIT